MIHYQIVILNEKLILPKDWVAKRLGLMILIWGMNSMVLFAQFFQTQTGSVQASGKYKGVSVVALSSELRMHLNYDLAEIHLQLAVSSLTSENISLQEKLQEFQGQELIFKGRLNISPIPTRSHPKQSYTTQGILQLNGVSRSFSFNVVLEHIGKGNVSCILSGEFIIHLDEFNVVPLASGEENVSIKFNQLVLKRPGERY